MSRRRYAFTTILLVLCLYCSARAGDTLRARYGLNIGLNRTMHSADFRELPGVPNCCPRFESGTGYGLQVQTVAEIPVSSFFLAGFRLGLNALNGTLTKDETIPVAINGQTANGVFTHTVKATLRTVSFDPFVSVRVFNGFFVQAGAQFGYLLNPQYEQEERITQPSDGFVSFLDAAGNDTRSRLRNQSAGTLPQASQFLMSAFGGISYELPMNAKSTVLLVPSVAFSYGLTPVVKNLSWSVNSITPSIGLRYSPLPKPRERIIYKEQIDTLRTTDSTTTATIVRAGMSRIDRSSELAGSEMIITETLYRSDTLVTGTMRAVVVATVPVVDAPPKETIIKETPKVETPKVELAVAEKKIIPIPEKTVERKPAPEIPKKKNPAPDNVSAMMDTEEWQGRCCHLLFLSTESKPQATALHDYVRKKLPYTKIVSKKNTDGVLVYNVISRCADSPQSADVMMNDLRQFIDRTTALYKLPEAPRIKCFDTK
ncbi:MAG: hypothetical protein JNL32_03305 [Candidatus Kapabacteria bacterium]|nr:hypothetical protein [Candidatus Kapabacteria bacterium]